MSHRIIFPGFLAVLAFFSGSVAAKPLLYEPRIFEGNGNAYVLIDAKFQPDGTHVNKPDLRWSGAAAVAMNMKYKGVSGRLAIIDSAALDLFIGTNLRPSKLAWIGIQFICDQQRWVYSSGETVPVDAYTNWHPTNWGANVRGNTLDCGPLYSFFGAFLMTDDSGRRWWALNTSAKRYGQWVVEFPLGETENTDNAADEGKQ